MRCLAPSLDNRVVQCSNLTQGSDHCKDHQNLLNPRYKQYKIICNVAKALHVQLIHNTETHELLRLYSFCNSAYLSRERYREDAYMPEYWDIGHGHQIRLFLELMCDCERRLTQVFDRETCKTERAPEGGQVNSSLTSEGSQLTELISTSIPLTREFMKELKHRRQHIQEDFDKLLKQYTSQDQQYYFRLKRVYHKQIRFISERTSHIRVISLLYLSFMAYELGPGCTYVITVPITNPLDWIVGCGEQILELMAEKLRQTDLDSTILRTLESFDTIVPRGAKSLIVKLLCFFKDDRYILSMNLGNRYIATAINSNLLEIGARQRSNVIVGVHEFKPEKIGLPRIEDTERVKVGGRRRK